MKGLGARDIAAIFQVDRYRSRLEVFFEKTGKYQRPEKETEAEKWAKRIHPLIAEEFAERTGLTVTPVNRVESHPTIHYLIGQTSYEVVEDGKVGLLTVKTTNEYRRKEWNEIPTDWMVRVQHNLFVLNAPFAYLAVLIGGNTYRQFRVEPDPTWFALIEEKAVEFWGYVERGEVPPIDGSQATKEFLNERYAQVEKERTQLPKYALQLIDEHKAIKEEMKPLLEEKSRIENQLKFLMGEYEVGEVGTKKVKWSNVTTERVDVTALKQAYPHLVKRFTKTITSRQMRIKG
jgi:predicted phage-related endonuclease